MSVSLTEENIRAFAAAWYYALDIHAPVEDCLKLLADENLEMIFPEKTMRSEAEFREWYHNVTNFFFDENHYVQSVQIEMSGEEAHLDISVGWQASWWIPPTAKSKRTSMNATQKWTVRPAKQNGKNTFGLEIVFYNATAKPFEYAPGFAQL